MRFRAKTVPENRIWFLVCGINLATGIDRLFIHGHSQGVFLNWSIGLANLLTAALALLAFYSQYTTYWEMDAEGLHQRRLWMNTHVRWQDVTRGINLWSSPYAFRVASARRGSGARTSRILVSPDEHDAFLDALRGFAPQVEFADESRKSILAV